jgi:hypothetical protein
MRRQNIGPRRLGCAGMLLALAPGCLAPDRPREGPAADEPAAPAAAVDSAVPRCPAYTPLKRAYFGDLHTHTTYSYDAYQFSTRTTPMDAYAFARGVGLDFAAVTDHAELLAIDYGCGADVQGVPYDSDSPYFSDPKCVAGRSTNHAQQLLAFVRSAADQQALCGTAAPGDSARCQPVIQEAWGAEVAAAGAALDRCTFTSFIGYEWTNSCVGDGGSAATCHKNVIFGDTNVPAMPFDALTYDSQEKLWSALDTGCNGRACNAITIPHNSNLSDGQAFSIPQGSEAHAIKYQKLVEVFQHKGGSECFYDASNPVDPTCDFNYLGGVGNESNLPASYVRSGLKQGLAAQADPAMHLNPLQLGIVGATDDHNGRPGDTREDTWAGHVGWIDDTAAARIKPSNDKAVGHNPGGVAVAWAEENTREAIFAAFQRRETYATSGPRMIVRMYQTWDQTTDFCADPNFPAAILAAGGQPMGSNIVPPPGTTRGAPRIVVYAARDAASRPDAANLEELDLVEAWIDPATGAARERVLRRTAPTALGVPTMCRTFTPNPLGQAPAFALGTPSLYYARVLQVPTARWSVYDCQASPGTNPTDCAPGGKLNVRYAERAWTSPVWYLP